MIYPAINVLEEEAFQKLLKIVSDLETDLVHADFADGSWLAKPNFCNWLQLTATGKRFEAHLMVNNPLLALQAGADKAVRVIIQAECLSPEKAKVLKDAYPNLEFVISVATGTPLETLTPYAVLGFKAFQLLTVTPGESGEPQDPDTISRIKKIKSVFPNCDLEIDGGVNENNLGALFTAGANRFAVTSALFAAPDIKEKYKSLKSLIGL
jgi:ribulose-phosphate 3-epimerase